jgi:NAD(P)-dependent dehydrogenase (short-subunit alcohol dehydrogenase family)
VKRIAVVGASSGLGRCLGIGLAQRGARVALLARRKDLLDSAAEEAGAGTVVAACDVTDPASVDSAFDDVVRELGGLDGVVYSTGLGILQKLEDLEPDDWNRVFATNVIGASQVTKAALPHLQASDGVAVYLSSMSASLTSPWPGLGSYTVTKAALDKLVDAWRNEHPEVGFTRVIVGECGGGEGDATSQFTSGWDADLAGEFFPVWTERGLIDFNLMDVEHLIDAVDAVLNVGATANIPLLAVTPRRAI